MAYLEEQRRVNRQTAKEEPYWRIGWWEGGKRKTKALGFLPKKEAERLLKVFEGKLAEGVQPISPAPSAPAKGATLRDAWERLTVRLQAQGAAKATRDSAMYAGRAVLPELGDLSLTELTLARLDDYVVERREEGRKSKTIQIEIGWVRQALQLAVEDGHLASMPRLPTIRLVDQRPHRWLAPNEQAQLLDHLPWSHEPGSAMAIYLCLQLGLRSGETTSRRWSDVRWDRGELLIGATEEGFQTKTRRTRIAPLAAPVLQVLREAYLKAGRDDGALICCGVKDFGKALTSACKRAGVPEIHRHGLRHSWASRLAMAGVDRPTLMALGGWTTGDMLDEVYAHASSSHVAAEVSRTALSHSAVTQPLTGSRRLSEKRV